MNFSPLDDYLSSFEEFTPSLKTQQESSVDEIWEKVQLAHQGKEAIGIQKLRKEYQRGIRKESKCFTQFLKIFSCNQDKRLTVLNKQENWIKSEMRFFFTR